MKKQLFITALFACTMVACADFDEPMPTQEEQAGSTKTRAGATTYTTLPDPYSLQNMQAIYDIYDGNTTLQATDKYVRFLPQDSTQLNKLEDFYDLDLFDYPLDIDIPEGVQYVDPTIPEGEPTWQYTTVPANFVFPTGITYETFV